MTQDPDLEGLDGGDGDDGGGLPGFIFDPIGVLKRRWKWMVLVLLIGLLGTGAMLYRRQPVYVARATVLVASQRISQQFVRSTVDSDQLEKISAIVGELTSRRNLARLVQEYELYQGGDGSDPLTLEQKVSILRSALMIKRDDSNNANVDDQSSATIFEIIYHSLDPEKAAAVANDLAGGFTDAHIRMRSRQARLTTEFLRRELEQAQKELATQEREITRFKTTHRGELPSELAMNISRLDRLQSQRQSIALQIAEAESRLATLAAAGSDVDPDSPEALLRSLQLRYKEQRTLYTEDHPNMISLSNQIEALEKQVADRRLSEGPNVDGSTAAGAARLTLIELRRQLAETVAEYEQLDRRVAQVPERAEELAAMEQRAEILRENHREFLRKVKQAELAESVESAQQGERATILDQAVPPAEPESSPLKMLVVLIVGSFGAAGTVAVLLELIDRVVVGVGEIEQQYRLPVLGSIPRL